MAEEKTGVLPRLRAWRTQRKADKQEKHAEDLRAQQRLRDYLVELESWHHNSGP